MNEQTDLTRIIPGTKVVGTDGQTIGMVEAARGESLRVAGHTVPAAAIARIEEDRVLLTKPGMRREAHPREVAHYKGRRWDEQIDAILEDEWRAQAASR